MVWVLKSIVFIDPVVFCDDVTQFFEVTESLLTCDSNCIVNIMF